MKPIAFIVYCVFFANLIGHVSAQDLPVPTNPHYTVKHGIDYTQGALGPLQADAYIPNGKGPFPGVLFIHGGGWSTGNRNQMVKLIKALADKGYMGFTIDYDIDPIHYPYPAALNESFAALQYMRIHAAEYHLDPMHIAVAGSSAGGELAALVALTLKMHNLSDAKSIAPVQAAIVLNGVLDLAALGDKSDMVTKYLGGPCTTRASICMDASPATQVHPGAPAFYVGHGTADEVVPFAQADAFFASLRSAKVPVRFFIAQNGPHTYWIKENFFNDNLLNLELFLSSVLHGH